MALHFKFARKTLTNIEDVVGRWQHEGGAVLQDERHVGNYVGVKRVTFHGTDQDGQNAAAVTLTIFFLGSHPPESITLSGAHDFASGNETGSVSAASKTQAEHIGKQFNRQGSTEMVTIE